MAADNFLQSAGDGCEKTNRDVGGELVPAAQQSILQASPAVPASAEELPVLAASEETVLLDPEVFAVLQPFAAYALPGFAEPLVAQVQIGTQEALA
jgi:hypothetical protein